VIKFNYELHKVFIALHFIFLKETLEKQVKF